MQRVTGVGGIFFKAANPKALADWYRTHLGLAIEPWGGATIGASTDAAPGVLWNPFAQDTTHFGAGPSTFMVNYRVADLPALLDALRGEGVEIVGGPDESEYGKFAWVLDLEGNKVELWEPPAGD